MDKPDDLSCLRCIKAKAQCIWETPSQQSKSEESPASSSSAAAVPLKRSSSPLEITENSETNRDDKRQKLSSLFKNEHIYAKVLEASSISSQFITSTQPLAPILSRDSLLCLDGEILGLYCPWRDVYYEPRDRYGNKIDKELQTYLTKKGAFIVPQISEQRRLVQLYLDNLYPFYPVVQRDVINDLQSVPLILLNAMMLAGVRYDKSLKNTEFRIRAEEFRSRCALLQMIESNKVTLIQSYLLLSSNEEGPEGPSSSREYISKAVILSIELGLHNLATSEQFDLTKIDGTDKKTAFRLNYSRNLMARLFWTSFCCDRTTAATSCTAMLYNISDMIVDEPIVKDFDDGVHQTQDYELFKRWYTLTKLFERVLMKVYRPPGKRSVDDESLELDLLNWGIRNLNATLPVESKFIRFFKIVHAYCNLLYLRCKIGFLDLIEDNIQPNFESNSNPLSTAGMYYVTKFSKDVIENLTNGEDNIEHIINTHALLHVLVLLHLEMESKKQITQENSAEYAHRVRDLNVLLRLKQEQFDQCLELLQQFRNKWWFSAAAFHLFKTLAEKQSTMKFSPTTLESIFINQGEFGEKLTV